LFQVRGWFSFIPFRFDPFKKRRRRKKTDKPAKKKKRRFRMGKGMKMGRKVLRAFRIRRMYLDIDTDDFILNAQLIPVFSALNSEHIRMRANFEGEASLLMDIRTRLGALLWAFMTSR
jgi:hypothetical protein